MRQPLPQKVRKNWLAGESACPTKAQALAQQRGTDAFVCQPFNHSDCFSASHGRGSDLIRNSNPSRDGVPSGPGAFAEES